MRADTAGLENALSKTDRATGPDGATYLVKENSNGEGYHFNRLEDGSSTQHRNADQAQPWTREQAISAAAQMARERASAKPPADASAAADAGTAAPKPSAQESAQAGQATAAEPVSQASEAPKASNAAETTTKTPKTQVNAVRRSQVADIFTEEYAKSHPAAAKEFDPRKSAMVDSIARAVDSKDADTLLGMNIGDAKMNPALRNTFERLTGVKLPKGRGASEAAVDQWAGVSPEQRAAKVAAHKAAVAAKSAANRSVHLGRRAESVHVQTKDGRTITGKQYVDELIGQGYDTVVSRKRGASTAYYLANRDGQGYALNHRVLHEYARDVLSRKAEVEPEKSETQAAADTGDAEAAFAKRAADIAARFRAGEFGANSKRAPEYKQAWLQGYRGEPFPRAGVDDGFIDRAYRAGEVAADYDSGRRTGEASVRAAEPAQPSFRVEPLGKAGLLVHGDKDAVRAKLAEAGFKKRGTPQKGALRFDARDRDAIEIALGTRAQGIPGTARDFWREQVSRGEKPQPVFAVLDAAGNWHGWSTSEAGAGREMAKLGNRGELLIRKQTAPKDIAPKPENSHASRTPGVEPVRRVGAPAAGADHGEGEAGHAGTAKPEVVNGDAASLAREIAAKRPFDDVKDVREAARAEIEKRLGADAVDGMDPGTMMRTDELTQAVHDGQYAAIKDYAAKLPVPITEEQVGRQLARSAFQGTSFTPEVRGDARLRDYVRTLASVWRNAKEAAGDDPEALQRVTDVMRNLQRGYADRIKAQLHAQGRIVSNNIAGFSKFPVERMRRLNEIEHKRSTEANEFLKRMTAQIMKAALAPVDHSPAGELARAHAKLQVREATQVRMKATNDALRRGDDAALANLGHDAAEIAKLKQPDFAGRTGYKDFELRNNNAEIKRLRARVEQLEKLAAAAPSGPVENMVNGVRVERNPADNRIRLHFDGKPSDEMRTALRGEGWKWSPKNEAWQRQLTRNAIDSAKRILARNGNTPEKPEGSFSKAELREARSLSDARKAAAQNIVGKTLENEHGVVPATLSRTTLDKMLSEKAVQKSVSGVEHARAVANLDHLYRIGMLDHSHPDSRGEPTIAAIHRVVAPMRAVNGDTLAVLMTVKETTHPKNPNPLYSVEAVRIEKPALLAPETGGERGTDSNRPPLQAGFDPNVTRMLQDFNDKSPKAARGLPRERVQQIVSEATAKWGSNRPSVRVVADAEGLPESAKRDPGYKTAEGYYDHQTGTAYLVASNLHSEARAQQVLAHEVIGHHGVEHIVDEALGAGAWQKIEDSVARLEGNPKVSAKVKDVLAETRRRYPDADARTFAKEFLAVSAEKDVRTGLLDRVVSAIRKFLRKVMPSLKISEVDLRQTLARAQDYVRRGERYADRVARIQSMVFSRQPDTFYSALAESVGRAEGAPKKGTAEQWKQWLDGAQRRGEFKGAEREWMGVDQWLDTHKGEPITRAEVQQFARDNQVRVQEVMHGDEPPSNAADIHENEDGSFDLTDEAGALANTPDRPTRYGEYQLPGGKNYRELLLTLPSRVPDRHVEQITQMAQIARKIETGTATRADNETYDRLLREHLADDKATTYRSGHFDTPNILAHVRFNDRTGPDGERILHVEEIQSDWHQAGRKRGYLDDDRSERIPTKAVDMGGRWEVSDQYGNFITGVNYDKATTEGGALDVARQRLEAQRPGTVARDGRVPDAPFKKEWPLLAMKRVLRYAAEHGYDKVTWTTGEQQAARYDLSKQVDAVRVMSASRGDAVHVMVKPKGSSEFQGIGDVSAVTKAKLPEVLGKDLAARALRDTADGKIAEYSGVDLKVGGEGMRAFYDKLLPNELNKYVKQWGAKVGATQILQRSRDSVTHGMYGYDTPYKALIDSAKREIDAIVANSGAKVHSIDITPAMREGVMQGQPMFSRPAQATMDDLDKVMAAPDPDRSVYEKAKAWLGGKGEDLRPAALGVLQTRHVLELMEHVEPLKGYGKEYGRSMQQLDTDRSHLLIGEPELPDHPRDPKNMLAKGAVPIAQALRDFTYKKGLAGWLGRRTAEGKALFDMMHQATIQGMDPDKEYERLTIENAHGDAIPWTKEAVSQRLKLLRELALQRGGDPVMREKITEEKKYLRNIAKLERTREQRWPELVRQWQALPEAAKDLYRQTRDWYAQHRDAVEQALVKNIEGYDVPETYRRSLIDRMRLQFEEARRSGVYFPLNRDGDYWIAFQDAKGNEGFKMFESKSAAAAAEQKLKRNGYQINASGRRDPNARAKSAPPGTFVREVIDILKKAGVSEKTQDAIYQSFLQTLPELSMRKHSIHRRNIAGFSEDGLRAFAKNSFHGAHQLAKLRHLQDMQTTLEAMQQTVDAWRKGGDEMNDGQGRSIGDTAKADALVGELGKRHQWILNPTDAQLANHANALGFVWYLGASPASALTNMTQVVQTVLPVLGAQHGWPKATRMLGAAWRDAARTVGHMDRTLTDPDERRAFLVMQQRGDFSKTQAHTLAGLAEGNVLQSSPAWTKTMNALSWMFHTAEVINREATGMAAFRLARARGDDFNKAIEYAGEINAGTNFDYSAANRPRLMQGNAMRIALQFKQYGVGMTWLFYRNLYQAMKGETPEVRRVARRTVTGILGMTALLAGTTGLPIYNGVKAAANAANLAFGDPDQPFDFDTEFHAWLAEHLGNEAANVIATGPVSELTGADFANRTSMANLFFQNNDQNLEGADAYHALLESLAGPMGGITKNFYVGAQRIREGNVQRGIETMLPTAVKNSVKALRFAHDGANTLRGDPILPDISGPQDFIQALGFRPTKLAQQEQVNSALVNFTKAVQERRQTLLNAYAMALHAGDPGDRAAVMEKIRAFNQQYPTIAVTPKTLRASLRSRARYSSQAVNGVAISPKLRMQAEAFAGANQGAAQ